MRVFSVQGPDSGLIKVAHCLLNEGSFSKSRAGDVISFTEPVSVIFERPERMISTWSARDANPFFHYFEAWWMLAGRDDGKWLDQFVHNFSSRFAEDDGTIYGAYGNRWRKVFGFDQLQRAVTLLSNDHTNRRVVIQMWDAEMDFSCNKKDHPCNLMIVPRIVGDVLNFTIYNRSNDIVWGTFGANAVHFPMLQQWMATRLKLKVGVMTIVSTNMHAYTEVLGRILVKSRGLPENAPGAYESTTFKQEVPDLSYVEDVVRTYYEIDEDTPFAGPYHTREFICMALMWKKWKTDKQLWMPSVQSAWIQAGKEWIQRRMT